MNHTGQWWVEDGARSMEGIEFACRRCGWRSEYIPRDTVPPTECPECGLGGTSQADPTEPVRTLGRVDNNGTPLQPPLVATDLSTEIPFTTFRGQLKQIDAAALPDIFDLFFPKFRTEEEWRNFEDIKLNVSARTTSFTSRGRERRFAGDKSLPRGRYHCVVDSPSNSADNNTLLCELFAYADPSFPVQPELLDSTIDVPQTRAIAEDFEWDLRSPCIIHLAKGNGNPWIFSPVIGIGPDGLFIRYPVNVVEMEIDKVIDLRLPDTLDWFMETFWRLEAETAFERGGFTMTKGKPPPLNLPSFLRLILSQQLGGGSTFIQGIGTWLRANGVNAIIYPSARSDSRTVVRDNVIVESFGYILLDYRGAPSPDFTAKEHFGGLSSWKELDPLSFAIEETRSDREFMLDIQGVRRLQECRFAMFHDWTTLTLARVQSVLNDGSESLSDRVKMVVRKPADVLGEWAEEILGPGKSFIIDEGGGAFAVSGFLIQWRNLDNARFTSSVLPLPLSPDWECKWAWDEKSWFLHRRCLHRPWVVLKCPVCYFEQFWCVTQGSPERACQRCKFSNSNDTTDLAVWQAWAAEVESRMTGSKCDDALHPDNSKIYSAVCHRARNAVTGEQPASQDQAILALGK